MKKTFNFLVIFVLLLTSCTLSIPDLFGASIVRVEYQDLEKLAVYLQNASDEYIVTIGEYKVECSFAEGEPDLLECVGPAFEPGEDLVIQFFEEEGGEPVAELTFTAPDIPTELQDKDGDGVPDGEDKCPTDSNKSKPGECGCGKPELDSDEDGVPDCKDEYPNDPEKSKPDEKEAEETEKDTDEDGVPDSEDKCPEDPDKSEPGKCGCGTPDSDEDEDGIVDCKDECPEAAYQDKIGDPCDKDEDDDGYNDGSDQCPWDPFKFKAGYCGCGEPETDTDHDGTPDCVDRCPENPKLTKPGECGCEVCDEDLCPDGSERDPVEDPCFHDEDEDGYDDWIDECPFDPEKKHPFECGCGCQECPDCIDECPSDPEKCEPGLCGCNVEDDETDTDGDEIPDCIDVCPTKVGPLPTGCPAPTPEPPI